MDRVSDLLASVLRKRGIQDHAAGAFVIYRARLWLADAHPALSRFAQPTAVRDGVLVIACSHSAALQECQSRAEDLLRYLRQECSSFPLIGIQVQRE